MQIHGFNKLTLLDYPHKTACTLFVGGCNFRCPFCHNASLVLNPASQPVIPENEIFDYLKKRKGLIDGVCITGGEPTLYSDLPEFIEKIKNMGYLVKLDTNGDAPKIIKNLSDSGLVDYIAMDIKNSLKNYGKSVGIINYDTANIEKSVDILMGGNVEYEFRTTVVKELNSTEDFLDIAHWLKGAKAYFLQAFLDSNDLIEDNLHGYSKQELEAILAKIKPFFQKIEIRGI